MKKYIYFVTNQNHWFNVSKKLYEMGIAEPVLWLGDDVHYDKAKAIFKDNVVLDLIHRHRNYELVDIEYNGEYEEFFFSENYLRAKDRCIKMMDRLDLYGTFGRLDRETTFHNLVIWNLKKIYLSSPDALIATEAPHDYAKYLIYEICLFLNIPCYKFVNWVQLPLLFLQNMKSDKILEKKEKIKNDFDSKMIDSLELLIESMTNKDNNYELPYMKAQRKKARIYFRLLKFFKQGIIEILKDIKHNLGMYIISKYNPINPFRLNIISRLLIQRKRHQNLLKASKESEEKIAKYNQYVYFPLHYEPERTTNPDGGIFHDQFLTIVSLRKMVPDYIDIIIKEHPSQFFHRDKGARGRSPLIYKLLKNVKGIKIAQTSHSSHDLIKNSIFTATIAGMAALEAAINGKKAIIFGSSWFNGCPNTFSWHEELSYKEIMEAKLNSKTEILNFLINHKEKYSVPGFINGSQRKNAKKDYRNDKFEELQTNSIYELLKQFFQEELS